jgi:hypothetical protein
LNDNLTSPVIKDCVNKTASDPVVLAAKVFISKLREHIARDNCNHCRSVLEDKAGNQPAQRTTATDPTQPS